MDIGEEVRVIDVEEIELLPATPEEIEVPAESPLTGPRRAE